MRALATKVRKAELAFETAFTDSVVAMTPGVSSTVAVLSTRVPEPASDGTTGSSLGLVTTLLGTGVCTVASGGGRARIGTWIGGGGSVNFKKAPKMTAPARITPPTAIRAYFHIRFRRSAASNAAGTRGRLNTLGREPSETGGGGDFAETAGIGGGVSSSSSSGGGATTGNGGRTGGSATASSTGGAASTGGFRISCAAAPGNLILSLIFPSSGAGGRGRASASSAAAGSTGVSVTSGSGSGANWGLSRMRSPSGGGGSDSTGGSAGVDTGASAPSLGLSRNFPSSAAAAAGGASASSR